MAALYCWNWARYRSKGLVLKNRCCFGALAGAGKGHWCKSSKPDWPSGPPRHRQRRISSRLNTSRSRRWIWIKGNHDPLSTGFAGSHLAEILPGPLTFRHIAKPGAGAEVSGHYHPKAGLRGALRPAVLLDRDRLVLAAFDTYTGGLRRSDPVLSGLMQPKALAILTGARAQSMPMPRQGGFGVASSPSP